MVWICFGPDGYWNEYILSHFLQVHRYTKCCTMAGTHTETICERHPRSARFNVGQFAKTEDVSEARESKFDVAGLEPWWNRSL